MEPQEYFNGIDAYNEGWTTIENPHSLEAGGSWHAWLRGWHEAERQQMLKAQSQKEYRK
jgi:hypothetical protein